jgi:hypothetical protein
VSNGVVMARLPATCRRFFALNKELR